MTDFMALRLPLAALIMLLCCSAFFSGSETSMMSLNRYRLRHTARTSRTARRVMLMLKRPDRLLGVILIGNTFANILASSIATVVAIHVYGDALGVPVATVGLTLVLLIFAEVMPKTLAALHPERFAFIVVYPLTVIATLLSPLVILVGFVSNGLLRLMGVRVSAISHTALSREELKSVVHESATRHQLPQNMLLRVLDLETVTVEDIMVPKSEIIGIDLTQPWEQILDQMAHTQHTLLPVYRDGIDSVLGVFHARSALNMMADHKLTPETLEQNLTPAYFIPEHTPLSQQLIEFRTRRQRFAVVVDEYGEILGLVTLADLLEEIVGEFTTDHSDALKVVQAHEDGTYLLDGSMTIRDLNRTMGWNWPQQEAKTLSGLVISRLECIPEVGTCLLVAGMPVEVLQVKDNMVKTLKIVPELILSRRKGDPL